jgi:hypothetical protein
VQLGFATRTPQPSTAIAEPSLCSIWRLLAAFAKRITLPSTFIPKKITIAVQPKPVLSAIIFYFLATPF